MPFVCIPFAATWMTGYSGQEKAVLTSCDSGKVSHTGSRPLNTQGAGSSLRGWPGAPLSSLVISWLLGWTSCPTFSDKLCLREWWAACHYCSLAELMEINCLAAQYWLCFTLNNGCWGRHWRVRMTFLSHLLHILILRSMTFHFNFFFFSLSFLPDFKEMPLG